MANAAQPKTNFSNLGAAFNAQNGGHANGNGTAAVNAQNGAQAKGAAAVNALNGGHANGNGTAPVNAQNGAQANGAAAVNAQNSGHAMHHSGMGQLQPAWPAPPAAAGYGGYGPQRGFHWQQAPNPVQWPFSAAALSPFLAQGPSGWGQPRAGAFAQAPYGYAYALQGSNGNANASASAPPSSAPSAGPHASAMMALPARPAAHLGGQAPQAAQAQAQAPVPPKSLFAQAVEAADVKAQLQCQHAAQGKTKDSDIAIMSAGEAAYANALDSIQDGTPAEQLRQLKLHWDRLEAIQAHRAPGMNVDSPQHSPNVDGEGNMRVEKDGDGS